MHRQQGVYINKILHLHKLLVWQGAAQQEDYINMYVYIRDRLQIALCISIAINLVLSIYLIKDLQVHKIKT